MPLAMRPSVIVPRTAPLDAADAAGKLDAAERDGRDRIEAERLAHRRIARRDAAGQVNSGDHAGQRAEHDSRRSAARRRRRRSVRALCAPPPIANMRSPKRVLLMSSRRPPRLRRRTRRTRRENTPTLERASDDQRFRNDAARAGQEQQRQALNEGHRGERHDQRMNAEDSHADAVREPDGDAAISAAGTASDRDRAER